MLKQWRLHVILQGPYITVKKNTTTGVYYWRDKDWDYEPVPRRCLGDEHKLYHVHPLDGQHHVSAEYVTDENFQSYRIVNIQYLEVLLEVGPYIPGKRVWKLRCEHTKGADYTKMFSEQDEALLLWYLDGYWNFAYNPKNNAKEPYRYDCMLQPPIPGHQIHDGREDGAKHGWFVGNQSNLGINDMGRKRWFQWLKTVKRNRNDNQFLRDFQKPFFDMYFSLWKDESKFNNKKKRAVESSMDAEMFGEDDVDAFVFD